MISPRSPFSLTLLGASFGALWWFMTDPVRKTLAASPHFTKEEFGAFWWLVVVALVSSLNAFRELLGVPVSITGAEGSVLRFGEGSSQHFFGRAVDIRWPLRGGKRVPLAEVLAAAKAAGFTGIGVYSWGFHLDVRPGATADDPATWGGVYYDNGKLYYVSMAEWVARHGVALGVA